MAKHNPCPFCESGNVTALGFYRSDGLWWVVECQNCHAYGSRAATYDRAWEYWDSYAHKSQGAVPNPMVTGSAGS